MGLGLYWNFRFFFVVFSDLVLRASGLHPTGGHLGV